MLDYMIRNVAVSAVVIGMPVATGIVAIAEGNPPVYVGPLVDFVTSTAIAVTVGIMIPWLVVLGVQLSRPQRSKSTP